MTAGRGCGKVTLWERRAWDRGLPYAATILLTTKMAAYGAVSVPG